MDIKGRVKMDRRGFIAQVRKGCSWHVRMIVYERNGTAYRLVFSRLEAIEVSAGVLVSLVNFPGCPGFIASTRMGFIDPSFVVEKLGEECSEADCEAVAEITSVVLNELLNPF